MPAIPDARGERRLLARGRHCRRPGPRPRNRLSHDGTAAGHDRYV